MTVQEQAAIKKLAKDAKVNDFSLLALEPRYLIIASLEIKLTIAPAKRNAGIRQVRTCRAMYSSSAAIPAQNKCPIIVFSFLKNKADLSKKKLCLKFFQQILRHFFTGQ
jgi:hypothetical protein